MKIRQIRNATLVIDFAGKRLLIDPMLSEKGAYPGFPGTYNDHLRNPLVELTVPISEIVNVDAVFLTHPHLDHWDDAARKILPKDIPLFVQNDEDEAMIRGQGFFNVSVMTEDSCFGSISVRKTKGQHGTDKVMTVMKDVVGFKSVCGIVFAHPEEKTLYLAGDTIWNGYVVEAIETHRPDVIVIAAGHAHAPNLGPIIMGVSDTREVTKAAPKALVIASHMEAVNPCQLSRADLRAAADEQGFGSRLVIPQDGDVIVP